MSVNIEDFVQEYSDETLDSFEAQFGKQGFWKPVVGTNQIRILPNKGGGLPFEPSFQHFYDDPADPDRQISHNCPRRMAKQRCPTCEAIERLSRSDNRADLKLADNMKASFRAYYRILDRANPAKGVQVWAVSWGMQQDLTGFIRDFKSKLTHPIEGFDLNIRRKGTGKKDTRYRLDVARDPSPVLENVEETLALLEAAQAVDIQRYAAVPTYDQCVARIVGQDGDGGAAIVQGSTPRGALPAGDGWDDEAIGDAVDASGGNTGSDDNIPF
jgi:hypothetical protein